MTKQNGSPQQEVDSLLHTLDQVAAGMLKLEARLQLAIQARESGQHTLRIRLDNGAIRKVVHAVEDEI